MVASLQEKLVNREHRAPQINQRAEIRFHALRQRSQIPADILLGLRKRLELTPLRGKKNRGKVLLDAAGDGRRVPRGLADLGEEKAEDLVVQPAPMKRLDGFVDAADF